jgi:hypothetical protein
VLLARTAVLAFGMEPLRAACAAAGVAGHRRGGPCAEAHRCKRRQRRDDREILLVPELVGARQRQLLRPARERGAVPHVNDSDHAPQGRARGAPVVAPVPAWIRDRGRGSGTVGVGFVVLVVGKDGHCEHGAGHESGRAIGRGIEPAVRVGIGDWKRLWVGCFFEKKTI